MLRRTGTVDQSREMRMQCSPLGRRVNGRDVTMHFTSPDLCQCRTQKATLLQVLVLCFAAEMRETEEDSSLRFRSFARFSSSSLAFIHCAALLAMYPWDRRKRETQCFWFRHPLTLRHDSASISLPSLASLPLIEPGPFLSFTANTLINF
jgi:hypothetical protein